MEGLGSVLKYGKRLHPLTRSVHAALTDWGSVPKSWPRARLSYSAPCFPRIGVCPPKPYRQPCGPGRQFMRLEKGDAGGKRSTSRAISKLRYSGLTRWNAVRVGNCGLRHGKQYSQGETWRSRRAPHSAAVNPNFALCRPRRPVRHSFSEGGSSALR
jgi:hypothetical protein